MRSIRRTEARSAYRSAISAKYEDIKGERENAKHSSNRSTKCLLKRCNENTVFRQRMRVTYTHTHLALYKQ